MTPEKLTITGAHGIRAGLNRDTLTIDLAAIPEDAVTVALRGDNGSGKSTLLNLAMTPWREPPQLPGNVYDEFGPEGLRELVWAHDGRTYRTRIEYKQSAKTRTQRAYLHEQHGDEWSPVDLPDNTVSDGKASTYDACLAHILGPREIYYLSAFRAQNAPKLADYDDPKGLMRALLSLDEPETLRAKCRDVVRELKRRSEALSGQHDAAAGQQSRIVEIKADIATIDASISEHTRAKAVHAEAIAKARAELDRAMADGLDEQRIREQRADLQRRLSESREIGAATISRIEQDIAAARVRHAAAAREAQSAIATLTSDKHRADLRASSAAKLLERRDEIESAATEAEAIASDIARKEQTIEDMRGKLSELRELANRVGILEVQQASVDKTGEQLRRKIEELRIRAGFVADVPCRGEGEYSDCPALREAKAAADDIPIVEGEIKCKRLEWEDITDQALRLRNEIALTGDVESAHQDAARTLSALRTRLETLRRTAAEAVTLDQADATKREAEAEAEDLRNRIDKANLTMVAAGLAANGEIEDLTNRRDAARAAANTAVEAIKAELSAVPEPTAESAVAVANKQLSDAENGYQDAMDLIERYTATSAKHSSEIAAIEADLLRSAAVRMQAEALNEEVGQWTLLGMALRGVVDLSIEDAGPSIAEFANRLLTEAYGPRFSVRIVTQREQANGRLVECFDISVIDGESGIESSIMHKSGGEAVWLDKALTDAVGLYHQESAGVTYECIFADEAEDGLTQERKTQFYRMDRAALDLGGYRRKFVVSHNPEAWAMADHVIDLDGYREAA